MIQRAANGGAAQALRQALAPGIATATEQVIDDTKRIIAPQSGPLPPRTWVDDFQHLAKPPTEKACRTPQNAARGGAPGRGGLYYEHLQLLLTDANALQSYDQFVTLYTTARLTDTTYDLANLSKATPLLKPNKDVRPLVCASTIRRHVMSATVHTWRKKHKKLVGPTEFAIGVTAALEKLNQALNLLAEHLSRPLVFADRRDLGLQQHGP